MLDLSTITAKAKEAPRQTTDVEVVFDTGITRELDTLREERNRLTARLDEIDSDLTAEIEQIETDRRNSDPRPAAARAEAEKLTAETNTELQRVAGQLEDVEARAAEFLVTFRFTALHGFEWADLTSRSMPREGVADDAQHNWNVDEVTRIVAARTGVRVGDDGELIDVSTEQWAAVWETLPPSGLRDLRLALLVLNEYSTIAAKNEAVVAARKVSTARQARTQPSPSDSESTPAA